MDLSRDGNSRAAPSLLEDAPSPDAGQQPHSPLQSASNSSPSQSLPVVIVDDNQSLTSFPSLSTPLENSPEPADPSTPRPNDASSLGHAASAAYGTLFTPTQDSSQRSALFEDTPQHPRDVPGALHLQPDQNVEHLLSKTGAVALVKQLAEDLAQRDAYVTLLQRRAEEREALLRKMLRDCEISNLDIENRLRDLDRPRHRSTIGRVDSLFGQDIGSHTTGMEPSASMDDRMSLAVRDTIEASEASDTYSTSSVRGASAQDGTIREPRNKLPRDPQDPPRGWKDYFIPGGASKRQQNSVRAAAISSQRTLSISSATGPGMLRRPLDSASLGSSSPAISRSSSIAQSLNEVNGNALSRQISAANSDSAVSSKSAAAWALRLVAGNTRSDKSNTADQSSSASTSGLVNGFSVKGTLSANSAVDRSVGTSRAKKSHAAQARSSRSSFSHANENSKKTLAESSRSSTKDIVTPSSPQESIDGAVTNLGPVEMDTILPEGTRPPTLSQNVPHSSADEYLTDSFGFIYDQRRRKRQNDAEAALARNNLESIGRNRARSLGSTAAIDGDVSNLDQNSSLAKGTSRPETSGSAHSKGATDAPKRWQDYLKLATFSTELLSHTPSAGPITDITTGDSEEVPSEERLQSHIHMSKRGSMPALGQVPAPSPTRVVSENAELVAPTPSTPASPGVEAELELDPVKALVEHLAEVHELAQREKSVKWNEFLRKVRVDQRRDINSKAANDNRSRSATMPETLLGDGELIGIAGLGVKGKVGRAKSNVFRSLILGGIPTAYRAKIWAEGSGAVDLRIPGYYEELTNSNFTDMAIVQQIQMDITRTLTDNIYYRRGPGVDKLKEVLLAYARRNPDIGYCQGMNLITANLLLIMPAAEDAFWVLTSMIENILPEKYYDSSLLTSRADQVVLRQYVSEILPQLSAHLETMGVELEALTFQWFLSVFTDCLSAEALFRVWDVVLCISDGGTFLFQVALALLKLNEKSLLQCDSPAGVYGYINQGMTDHAISIDNLIRASDALKKEVRTEDILKRRREAVAQELETARQREAIRKGKAKARVDKPKSAPATSDSLLPAKLREPGRIVAADEIARSRPSKLTRAASRSEFDEEARQALGELEVRTPMPIDEEALWRG